MKDLNDEEIITEAFKDHKKARALLTEFSFEQVSKHRVGRRMLAVVIVTLLGFVLALSLGDTPDTRGEVSCYRLPNGVVKCYLLPVRTTNESVARLLQSKPWSDALTVLASLLAAGMLFVGIEQWNVGNRQQAFDVSFERKKKTNELILDKRDELEPLLTGVANNSQNASLVVVMFVFAELDNLEYVFEKYRDGLISPKPTLRAVLIFFSRCQNAVVRRLACELVLRGRYRSEFRQAVGKIAESAGGLGVK